MNQVFEDFVQEQEASEEMIQFYKNKVPKEMTLFWGKYGLGTFLGGFLKAVDPDEYQELLIQGSQRFHDGIVLFVTAMGDLIVWSDNYVRILRFRYGVTDTIMSGFKFFFEDLSDSDFRVEDLKCAPYFEAVEINGTPAYDECFGYIPLLGLGGSESVENMKKVKLKEHILIIIDFMGPIL